MFQDWIKYNELRFAVKEMGGIDEVTSYLMELIIAYYLGE